mgnify:CR=1 FL=1
MAGPGNHAAEDNFAQYQGTWGQFGQINVRDDSIAHLEFSFVDAETSGSVSLEQFYFTVFDVDQQKDPEKHAEALCIDNDQFDEFILADTGSEVAVASKKKRKLE